MMRLIAAPLSVICCVLGIAGVPRASAAEPQLLSRHANYRIIGESYLYSGQYVPGTNEKVGNAAGFRPTPLVEMTDTTGAALIDGDARTLIYTPWAWRDNCKRITVEMSLPGDSRVSRVVVRLPDESTLRPQDITLSVRGAAGDQWRQIEAVQTGPKAALSPPETREAAHTFEFPRPIACRELQIVCIDQGVMTAQCGIADIEVYGDGPTAGSESGRGLIRADPHIKAVMLTKSKPPAHSKLLTNKANTKVKLSGTPVTSGDGSALVDGNRSTGIRIDREGSADSELIAELDLGDVYAIDAIYVYLPGGEGTKNGHINDLELAISASADEDARDWQVPVDRIVNPYWPDDDAPESYPIPIENLNVFGQRIRITANLSGESGVTRRLAVSDIEVWGHTADDSQARRASVGRVRPTPIESPPEPVAEIHPKLNWLVTPKVRGIWAGEEICEPFGDTGKTKGQVVADAGFNLYCNIMTPDKADRAVSSDIEKHLADNIAESRRVGIHYLVAWQYGSNHEEPYPRYRAPNGCLADKSCCPLDAEYFDRHIVRWAKKIASAGAEGMLIDTEMYESDQTQYPGPCVCDECFATYLKAFASNADALYEQVEPARRGTWLSSNRLEEHYRKFGVKRSEELWDSLRAQCQKINPTFLFVHAPGLEYLPGIERGLGTSSIPCLVFSEREYNNGMDDTTIANVKKVHDELPALYIPGSYLVYQSPDDVERNATNAALYADGWWLYYGWAVLNHRSASDPEAFHPAYGRVKGTSARDYLDRITAANQRIDRLLSLPTDQWPTPQILKNP